MRWVVMVFLLGAPVASAHEGALDACFGHQVTEQTVYYPDNPEGQPSYPSEPGEYHVHWTKAQLVEAKVSLEQYADAHPRLTAQGEDFGSFTVGGQSYDILHYTRQDVAIVRCRDGATGIVRARE